MQLKHNQTHDARETIARHSDRAGPRQEVAVDYDDGLLGAAAPIMISAYGLALFIAVLTFIGSGEALLAVGISAVYGVMYFGIPVLMTRIRNSHDERWRANGPERVSDRVAIYGGTIRRHEAILQIVIVPVCVAFAFAAFATIWILVRP